VAEHERIMFEIYREADYDRLFRVVYFTELDEHNKESEINRAMAGEHVYDGFIPERNNDRHKAAIAAIVDRLNADEPLTADHIETTLSALN
jgi:hypothetical protein